MVLHVFPHARERCSDRSVLLAPVSTEVAEGHSGSPMKHEDELHRRGREDLSVTDGGATRHDCRK
jgi:hypothetical protein